MAAGGGGPGSSSVSVCCPVCYREYSHSDTDLVPRILHCGHSFCTECLHRLLDIGDESEDDSRSDGDVSFLSPEGRDFHFGLLANYWGRRLLGSRPQPSRVRCPVCKRTNHIQGGEVTNLTKNFALLSVQENSERNPALHYCQEHDHEQRIYCEECQQLVCAYCQLYGRHKTHKCVIATEACRPAVQAVRELWSEVEGQLKDLEAGEAAVLASVQQLEDRREQAERQIHLYFGQFINALQEKREAELRGLQTWSDDQACILQAQLRSLSGARKTCRRLLEDCRRVSDTDPLQALYEQEPLTNRAEDVKAACSGLPCEPIVTPHLQCEQSAGLAPHLQALLDGLSVTMSLDRHHSEERRNDLPTSAEGLLHAQDTEHLAEGPGSSVKLHSSFPLDPSPSLATPSTPNSYSTPCHHSTSVAALYSASGRAQSPSSSNSEPSLPDEGEFRNLPSQPYGFPLWPRLSFLQHGIDADEEAGDLADEELLENGSPLPTHHHFLPANSNFSHLTAEENEHEVNVSIAGQGLHISVSSSAWPTTHYPSILLDSGEAATAEDSD